MHSVGEVGTAAVTVMIAGQEGLRHAVSQHREAVLAGSTALEACIENHQASQIPYSIDWLSLG